MNIKISIKISEKEVIQVLKKKNYFYSPRPHNFLHLPK